jgi:hypothetical protein
MRKATKNTLAVFGLALGLLAMSGIPAVANHIDTANVTPACNSYTISVSASDLNPGQNYTIDYSIDVMPTCSSTMTITNSISFVAPGNGTR